MVGISMRTETRNAIIAVTIISIIIGSSIVIYLNTNESDTFIDYFAEFDSITGGEALAVSMLFNHSFADLASVLAGTTVMAESRVMEIAKYLASNPSATENLYIESLYDAINQISIETNSLHSAILSQDHLDFNLVTSSPKFNYYSLSYYYGRVAGIVRSTYFEFDSVSEYRQKSQLADSTKYKISTFTQTTPIVLDLDGNGLLDASNGAWLPHPDYWSTNINLFDINSDGIKEIMEWVGPNDGLLVNISPSSESELTGANLFGDSDGWDDGYQKLSLLDTDQNMILQNGELNNLYVWRDANQDAITQPAEIQSLSELDITQIDLNSRAYRSRFIINGAERILWDWHPNSLRVLRVDDSPNGPIPDVTVQGISPMGGYLSGLSFNLSRSQIEAMNLQDARLVGITDSGIAVLIQRSKDITIRSDGYHQTLILLRSNDGVNIDMEQITLPIKELINLAFLNDLNGAIIIGDGGSKILQVDFTQLSSRVLFENEVGASGYRAGGHLSVIDDSVYNWGAFYSDDGALIQEAITSFPLSGGNITPLIDTYDLFSNSGVDPIIGSIVSNKSAYFVSKNDNISLSFLDSGTLTTFDSGTRFGGIWGAGSCVLYLLERQMDAGYEVTLYDTLADTIDTIAVGDYSFPVMSRNGDSLAYAEYDYGSRTMSYYLARRYDGYTPAILFSGVGIGPIRFSPDGSFYVFQSTSGIIVSPI